MVTGLEAQMTLAALAVQSVLFGIYIALVLAMFYLLTLRPHSRTVPRTGKLGERLLLAGLMLLSTMITGQWICLVIRAFQAFILWEGGQHADSFYANITGTSEVLRSAFYSATVTIADLFVVARLYVIWNCKKSVIILPITALGLLLVSAVGVTYAYGAYEMVDPATLEDSAVHLDDMSVITLMAESAALYTSLVLVAQITYGTDHVSNYFFNDCIPPTAALAAVLVHRRVMTSLINSYIISIGGLSLVHLEYGPTCSAFAASVYLLYQLGCNAAIADYMTNTFDEIAWNILPQFVQQYLSESPPPKETSVSTFRDKSTGRRGFVVTERVSDDVKVTTIEEKRGRDGRVAKLIRAITVVHAPMFKPHLATNVN
ncbi:hypothetical protein EV714DRAFT_271311 [Schizophyllum commune]